MSISGFLARCGFLGLGAFSVTAGLGPGIESTTHIPSTGRKGPSITGSPKNYRPIRVRSRKKCDDDDEGGGGE